MTAPSTMVSWIGAAATSSAGAAPARVADDLRALRELAWPVDPREPQRHLAGQGRMPVIQAQERGHPTEDVVDGGAGDRPAGEHVVVEPETAQPLAAPGPPRRLGVQAASIYHYVDGRAGVIELLRGRIGGLIDPAPLERRPAEVALRAYFRSYCDVFAAHARVLPLLATTTVRSPEVIPGYERVIALLRETGVPAGDVMAVLTAMENFILGSALDLAGPEVMWDIPPGVEAPFLNEALAAQPEGTRRADRAFELGLDTMLGLMLRYATRD